MRILIVSAHHDVSFSLFALFRAAGAEVALAGDQFVAPDAFDAVACDVAPEFASPPFVRRAIVFSMAWDLVIVCRVEQIPFGRMLAATLCAELAGYQGLGGDLLPGFTAVKHFMTAVPRVAAQARAAGIANVLQTANFLPPVWTENDPPAPGNALVSLINHHQIYWPDAFELEQRIRALLPSLEHVSAGVGSEVGGLPDRPLLMRAAALLHVKPIGGCDNAATKAAVLGRPLIVYRPHWANLNLDHIIDEHDVVFFTNILDGASAVASLLADRSALQQRSQVLAEKTRARLDIAKYLDQTCLFLARISGAGMQRNLTSPDFETWNNVVEPRSFLKHDWEHPTRAFIGGYVAALAAEVAIVDVAEVGPGSGHDYQLFMRQIALTGKMRYTGYEGSARLAASLCESFPEMVVVRGGFEALPTLGHDVVLARHVLEHQPDLEGPLRAMARSARSACIIGWFIPPETTTERRWLDAERLHYNRWAVEDVQNMLQDEGFVIHLQQRIDGQEVTVARRVRPDANGTA